ncbi:MAG: AraC family transcriptional regulator [Pseudomonadota bacterium]
MPDEPTDQVAIYQITQATTATFADLYLRLAFLFFIQTGSKRVVTPTRELIGDEGDLLIFPPAMMVTMENRPFLDQSYRALGVSLPDDLIRQVFADNPLPDRQLDVQILRADPHRPADLVPIIRDTLDNTSLPEVIRRHRLLEPLIWLKEQGVHLAPSFDRSPLSRVRRLVETDLSHSWRAGEVAEHLAMSEPTMRRWLAGSGQGFSKILLYTRLEHGLSLLQTSDVPISEIALECGFKTPSHFSDAFRKRFGIAPKQIRKAGD